VERLSGTSKTHGEPHGELEDISKSKEELTCVPLLNATLTHSLTDPIELKLDLHSFIISDINLFIEVMEFFFF